MKRTTDANTKAGLIPKNVPLVRGVDLISHSPNARKVKDAGSQGNGREPNFSLGNGSNHRGASTYCTDCLSDTPGLKSERGVYILLKPEERQVQMRSGSSGVPVGACHEESWIFPSISPRHYRI
jgi:hypothetical protein